MRIGDAARRAGATVKAVRYYEALGLVTPGRLGNGYRDYDEHDVRIVREIRALSRLGIPVELTRPFLDCIESGRPHPDDCPASLAGYQDAIDDLTRRIDELSDRRAALVRQLHEAAHRNSTVPRGEPVHDDFTRLPARLPVPQDDGACDHLPGLALPRVGLTDTGGRTVRLDAPGPGRTVVYVYPLTGRPDRDLPEGWDSIPGARGCTPESCGFRDHHEELVEAGAGRVFGLSCQDTAYQREVVERLRLPFAILSDPDLRLADELKLPTFEAGGQRLFRRLTLVLRDGVVEHVFYPVFPPDRHAEQVLGWLRAHPA